MNKTRRRSDSEKYYYDSGQRVSKVKRNMLISIMRKCHLKNGSWIYSAGLQGDTLRRDSDFTGTGIFRGTPSLRRSSFYTNVMCARRIQSGRIPIWCPGSLVKLRVPLLAGGYDTPVLVVCTPCPEF